MSSETTRFQDFLNGTLRRTIFGGPRNSLAYFLTRFYTLRRAARLWKRHRRAHGTGCPVTESVFTNIGVSPIVGSLQTDSHAVGIDLPPPLVEEIHKFAEKATCTAYTSYDARNSVSFLKGDWQDAERRLGKPIVLGQIRESSRDCSAIRRIEQDPLIHEIAEQYLGYPPHSFDSRLYWSFVRDLSDRERASHGQNVFFHYDLHGFHFNSLYFQFYITDVDETACPLELVRGSHGAKPLRFLLSSANQSEARVHSHYGSNRVVTLTGPRGFGFVMDGYCMHRATAPRAKERLFLQIRVS
jgi:Phytanoyl-CoA dioxygenase (PhyH)